jgi:general secretion pathway protein C
MLALVLFLVPGAAVVSPAGGLDDVALVGLVHSALAAGSSVVLRVGARTRVVGVGDQVRGARVVAIDPGLLVLDDGGRRHELRLSAAPGPLAAPPPAPATETPQPRDDGRTFARAEVERRIAEETPRLLSETALIPVSEDGRVTGFTLSRLPDNSLLTDLGLQAGDVLTEINGTAVDSMATLLALYARLRNESEVRAVVLRGGSQVPLVVRLR